MTQILYSRYEDGSVPVRFLPDGWEVLTPDGKPEAKYTTVVGLLSALTGHPTGRHWSLERYFRLGTVHGAPTPMAEGDVFALFPSPELSLPTRKLGIDLQKRAHEVRKLLYAGFGRKMHSAGYDPEDVLQEVYKGLMVRNEGKCPWDPSKSSFGHYVHMVCGCILSNYHRKQARTREVEQVGLPSAFDGDESQRYGDVASNVTIPAPSTYAQEGVLLHEEVDALLSYLKQTDSTSSSLATRVLPLVLQGVPRKEMLNILGVNKAALTRAFSHLREQTLAWKKENGSDSGFQVLH